MSVGPFQKTTYDRLKKTEWLFVILLFFGSFVVYYTLCLREGSDISIHSIWASERSFLEPHTFFRQVAHPLWHILVRLFCYVFSRETAAALVTAGIKVIEWFVVRKLFSLVGGISRKTLDALALFCICVAPLCLTFYNPTVYDGVGSPNPWHSPTQLIVMPLMILCVAYTAHCYDVFVQKEKTDGALAILPWKQTLILGVMLLLSLLAKPTFMQAFLPASCLFFLVQWFRYSKNSAFFLRVILSILPAILFMILQYLYYFTSLASEQGNMVVELSLEKCQYVSISVLLMIALPLYIFFAYRKENKPIDTVTKLTWIFFLVSYVEYVIFGETGRRAGDGNFGWGMMGAALMMWIIAIIHLLRAKKQQTGNVWQRTKRDYGAIVLFIWHAISSVWYVVYLLTNQVNV